MPELPEVETTRRGILPHLEGKRVKTVTVRNSSLRWPIPADLAQQLQNKTLRTIHRRGKYLLLEFKHGHVIWHLGMSGSLRIIKADEPPMVHDHVDLVFSGNLGLRYTDPRRFGAVLWTSDDILAHKLLNHLGPEPLTDTFSSAYLFEKSRKRSQSVKTWIMDSKVVVGVGNIYANEALFNAGIHPLKAAGKLTQKQCDIFCEEIKTVLASAIQRGGTTLKDFVGGDGKPGYFAQELNVYGRGGEACKKCKKPLTEKRLGQRTTVYCTQCQK